ncbi:MAG: transposase family protein [Prevotellaceae bacterium]|jgi:hypothetical protein|nr:transposase family protein [Prevotellaceae bacterium]
MPIKKLYGKQLSDIQNKENNKISDFRIFVEHAIGASKNVVLVKERFRCRKFDLMIQSCLALQKRAPRLRSLDLSFFCI